MAADRQHLHHRLLNIGHSYRQSVLIMYLWAALFSVAVVSLSMVRSPSFVFAAATLVAVLALLVVTMPRLRPWRSGAKAKPPRAARVTATGPRPARPAPAASAPVVPSYSAPAPVNGATPPAPGMPSLPATPPGYAGDTGPFRQAGPFPGEAARLRDLSAFPGDPHPGDTSPLSTGPLPRAGRLPEADPFPFPGDPWPGSDTVSGQADDGQDPFPQGQRPDTRPWALPLLYLPLA